MHKIYIFLLLISHSAVAKPISANYDIKINNIDHDKKTVDFDIYDQDSILEANVDRDNYPKNKVRILINILPVAIGDVNKYDILAAKKTSQEIIDGQDYTLNKYPISKKQIINVYYNSKTKEILFPNDDKNEYTDKTNKNIAMVKAFLNKKYKKFDILEFDIAGAESVLFRIDDENKIPDFVVKNSENLVKLLLDIGEKYHRINIDFLMCRSHLFTKIKDFLKQKNKDNKIINVNLYEGSLYLEHYLGSFTINDNNVLFDEVSKIKNSTPFVIKNHNISNELKNIINSGQLVNTVESEKFRIIFNRLVLVDFTTRENKMTRIKCEDQSFCPVFTQDIKNQALRFF